MTRVTSLHSEADRPQQGRHISPTSGAPNTTSLKRVAAASSIGTTIEYYDFFIYGTAAALVFPSVFFPNSDPAVGTIASFATFAVAFFARPVGSIIFGHFGDSIGRKRTLVWTLLIMGVATVGIGFMPGYETGVFGFFDGGIGIWAPVLLVVMRFLQGFAVGGEWAGATLLTAEYAPPGQRGRMAMWPQLGPAFAFFLASGTFFLASVTVGATSDAFLNYGWRIPFIASSLLIIVGFWIRLSVEETPVFTERKAAMAREAVSSAAPRKLPFMEVIKTQWREILVAAGATTTLFSLFYIGTAFLTSYGTGTLAMSRTTILGMGMGAAVVFGIVTALSSILSDKIGRKTIIRAVMIIAVPWALVLFPLLDTGSPWAFFLATTVTLSLYGASNGPTGALLPEMFRARFRYTGAGLSYNLAGILGGAIAPLVAAQIVADNDSIWVGVMLAALALLSVACSTLIKETKGKNMDDDEIVSPSATSTPVAHQN
ncbi:MFS transporter [Rhodococcus sp. Leaf7]|uniref:MFS transporter n=1 Tax=unclassified Rhodococcus (in: high G+C Gram-positive bacteria) TaxID=192944 RepID=UPI0007008260|nr:MULTISPECIES: MFS transporter [unclassified Rhodococcus (in: high G+C Gram-positive bacteria)]KQU07135.1 MFS transporter [Rhodococcus sp. Leaf7]KQU42653.1 MFS transporter [Rhodococcus sp. Leaf247]